MMMIAIGVLIALEAVLAGVLVAVFDLPGADADPRTERLSLTLLAATFLTATTGAAYALLA